MDLNTLRSLVTLLSFIAFIGVVLWAWSGKNRDRFQQAAMLPFAYDDDDDGPEHAQPPRHRAKH